MPRASLLSMSAMAVSIAVVVVGFVKGAFVAGGADSFGYVSQAHLWAVGSLHMESALMRELSGIVSSDIFAPLGYQAAQDGTALVPTYAPGFPMLMAVFERLGGSRAVFYVMPLLAGMSVWATYLIGKSLAGEAAGAFASILLATSPVFLFQLTSAPMGDIPATAWWALALALLLRGRTLTATAGAGLAAGAAILTRPNLVPIALVLCGLLLRDLRGSRSSRAAMMQLLLFSAGMVAASLIVARLYTYWYGSALSSGYGSLSDLFRWEHLDTNAARYSRWLIDSQTPVVVMGFFAPMLIVPSAGTGNDARVRAVFLVSFVIAVLLCYALYTPYDAWWYLRFLLPGLPALLVLTSIAILGLGERLLRRGSGLAAVTLVALVAWHGIEYARDRSVFNTEGERKYALIGNYVARGLPERAVVLSMQHSGSVRYYSGRTTLRYERIPPSRWDSVIDELRRRHYHPYLVLEDWEVTDFRERFKGATPMAALDWQPRVILPLGNIRIYDLDDWHR